MVRWGCVWWDEVGCGRVWYGAVSNHFLSGI